MIERQIAKGLLAWYEFKQDKKVLYVGKETDVIPELLKERGLCVTCRPLEPLMAEAVILELEKHVFDYIISIAYLEYCEKPLELLKVWKQMLKPQGTLLLGMNNRFGIRYSQVHWY